MDLDAPLSELEDPVQVQKFLSVVVEVCSKEGVFLCDFQSLLLVYRSWSGINRMLKQ
jgi:hypothetical protein